MTEPTDPFESASDETRSHASQVFAPLTDAEARDATSVATQALVQIVGLDESVVRHFPPQITVEKPKRRGDAPIRAIWVRARDRKKRIGYSVVVRDGEVVGRDFTDPGYPPTSPEEFDDARRTLREHPDYGQYLDRSDFDIQWFNPGHGDVRLAGARIVRVENDQVAEIVAAAVIDLDSATIIANGEHHG